MTYLVIVMLALKPCDPGFCGYYVEESRREIVYESMRDCEAQKYQREFLPPAGSAVAEVYFCMEQ